MIQAGPFVVTVGGSPTGNMASSFVSDPVSLDRFTAFAIQAANAGAPVGSVKLQASNDAGYVNQAVGPASAQGITNWVDIASSAQSIVAGTPNFWNDVYAAYKWARVVYTATSGTGTMSISAMCKADM